MSVLAGKEKNCMLHFRLASKSYFSSNRGLIYRNIGVTPSLWQRLWLPPAAHNSRLLQTTQYSIAQMEAVDIGHRY